jgi:hypothetical protein
MKRYVCLLVLLTGCSGSEKPSEGVPKKTSAKATVAEEAQPPDKPAPPDGPAIPLKEVFPAYNKNPIAADEKYKGKLVTVTAKVDSITPTSLGFFEEDSVAPAMSLKRWNSLTPAERAALSKHYGPSLICEIDPGQKRTFAGAEKGKPFTVVGRCAGVRAGTNSVEGWSLVLEQCRGVPPGK